MEYSQQFTRDFMRRTLDLVKQYKGEHDATLLLNCLLGLLIVPKESFINKIPEDPVSCLPRWGLSVQSIKSFGKQKGQDHPHTLRQVVWSLRNSVAHCRFEPVHENGKVTGFSFDDKSGFSATINLIEVRQFVERLAEYLEYELTPR